MTSVQMYVVFIRHEQDIERLLHANRVVCSLKSRIPKVCEQYIVVCRLRPRV